MDGVIDLENQLLKLTDKSVEPFNKRPLKVFGMLLIARLQLLVVASNSSQGEAPIMLLISLKS